MCVCVCAFSIRQKKGRCKYSYVPPAVRVFRLRTENCQKNKRQSFFALKWTIASTSLVWHGRIFQWLPVLREGRRIFFRMDRVCTVRDLEDSLFFFSSEVSFFSDYYVWLRRYAFFYVRGESELLRVKILILKIFVMIRMF